MIRGSHSVQRHLATANEHPTEEAQQRYLLAEYPCSRCEFGLPVLVDHSSEFYWHHKGFRVGCPRFGLGKSCGAAPRPGTAKVTHYVGWLRRSFVENESL